MGNCYACLFAYSPSKKEIQQLMNSIKKQESNIIISNSKIFDYYRKNPKQLHNLLNSYNVNIKDSYIYLLCLELKNKKKKEYALNKKRQSLIKHNMVKREQSKVTGIIGNNFLEYLYVWDIVVNNDNDFKRHHHKYEKQNRYDYGSIP